MEIPKSHQNLTCCTRFLRSQTSGPYPTGCRTLKQERCEATILREVKGSGACCWSNNRKLSSYGLACLTTRSAVRAAALTVIQLTKGSYIKTQLVWFWLRQSHSVIKPLPLPLMLFLNVGFWCPTEYGIPNVMCVCVRACLFSSAQSRIISYQQLYQTEWKTFKHKCPHPARRAATQSSSWHSHQTL